MAQARATELRHKLAQLKQTRAPLEDLFKKLQRYILPDTGRFNLSTQESSETGYEHILDATATDAIDVLGAGMLGGMTSPARPWFRLTTRSPLLDEEPSVKEWLANLQREMLMIFAKSNVYQALNNAYLELACYGTACLIALPSSREVIHLHEMTCGEYYIAEDSERRVNTVFREFTMTARNMVETFGEENCSKPVVEAASRAGTCFKEFDVIHAIEPRPDYDPYKKDARNFPYRSVYFEAQGRSSTGMDSEFNGNDDRVLREEGFISFPCLCPRWTLSKRSPYGRSPGMKALGVVMALQKETEIKDKGIDYAVNPPLLIPEEFESRPLDFGPGGVSFANINQASQVVSAWNVNIDVKAVAADIEDKRQQINDYFFKDLFMMLAQTARYGRTAYEVEKLDKEKMLIMGPVLERLHGELLDPLISATLQCMDRFGLIPEVPEEVGSIENIFSERTYVNNEDPERSPSEYLNIEYVSILAQAQRAAGVDAMSTYVQSLAGAAQIWPNVVDLLDEDKWGRTLADQLGVEPEMIRTKEEVEEVRAARAQQQQQAQQMEQMQQMADMASKLPQVSSNQVTQNMMGYGGL